MEKGWPFFFSFNMSAALQKFQHIYIYSSIDREREVLIPLSLFLSLFRSLSLFLHASVYIYLHTQCQVLLRVALRGLRFFFFWVNAI